MVMVSIMALRETLKEKTEIDSRMMARELAVREASHSRKTDSVGPILNRAERDQIIDLPFLSGSRETGGTNGKQRACAGDISMAS